jgi:hypothetical protein
VTATENPQENLLVTRIKTSKARARRAAIPVRPKTSSRTDLDSIAPSFHTSLAGLQAMVQRMTTLIEEAIAEWRTAARVMAAIGPWHSVGHLDRLAVASCQLALADLHELTLLTARSQRDAFAIVRQRIDQNIHNVQRLLRA